MLCENKMTQSLKELLLDNGADLVGIGDLREIPKETRLDLPTGVSIAVKYPKDIIRGISEYPTSEYKEWYGILNEKLDYLVTLGADMLTELGYHAVAKTRKQVGGYDDTCRTLLPHKTVATRAGLGWIGKNALLVTEQYGSMVRISSILTDAPLTTELPVNTSKCGKCTACFNACPAGAIHGTLWNVSTQREELVDIQSCRSTAKDRSELGFGKREDICGKCIEICPYTRRYLNQK